MSAIYNIRRSVRLWLSDRGTTMRVAFIALAAACQIGRVSAAELTLRCDPIDSRVDPLLIFIDMSQRIVHEGVGPNSQWSFRDGTIRRYKENDVNLDHQDPHRIAETGCIYDLRQFVSVSESAITYGESGSNINTCGQHDLSAGCGYTDRGACYSLDTMRDGPGTNKIGDKSTIDRNTGILTQGGFRYQCQVFSGKPF